MDSPQRSVIAPNGLSKFLLIMASSALNSIPPYLSPNHESRPHPFVPPQVQPLGSVLQLLLLHPPSLKPGWHFLIFFPQQWSLSNAGCVINSSVSITALQAGGSGLLSVNHCTASWREWSPFCPRTSNRPTKSLSQFLPF